MKKILCLCLMCLACFNLMAQSFVDDGGSKRTKAKSLPAMIQQALDNGVSRGGFYQFVNTSGKKLSEGDFYSYCNKNNIIFKEVHTSEVSRFGDCETSVSNALILPKSQLSVFVFHQMKKTNTPFSSLSRKGKCYTYRPSNETTQIFYPWEVSWSGEVVNGLIQGTGEGFGYSEKGKAVYFKGTFNHGLPEGNTTFYYVWWTPEMNVVFDGFSSRQEQTCQTGKYSEGLLSIKGQYNQYGFVDEFGNIRIKPQFKDVIKPFINGRAIVSRNDTSEMYIDKNAKVLGITEACRKNIEEARQFQLALARSKVQKDKEAELKRKQEAAQAYERKKQLYEELKDKFKAGDVYRREVKTWKHTTGLFGEHYVRSEILKVMIAAVILHEESYRIECTAIVLDSAVYKDGYDKIDEPYKYGHKMAIWPVDQEGWKKVN